MREIKFRAKQLITDKWIHGALVKERNGWSICNWATPDYSRYEVYPETVGQYTGLKDKNGKEIYEGDIVSINGDVRRVEYADGAFWLTPVGSHVMALWEYYDLCEVIGNIYENPELLE